MSAILSAALYLDTFCDSAQAWTIYSTNSQSAGLVGATVQLAIRAVPTDATPLVLVTTTVGPSGLITLGVAPPAPLGAACSNLAELLALGAPFSLVNAPPAPVGSTVATLAALAALPTTPLVVGAVAFVTAGVGAYYLWSPGDANTPNGTTIVATTSGGTAGNWLLSGTVTVTITAAAMAALVGIEQASFDLLVTWGSGGGTTSKLVEGPVYIEQTIAGH